MALKAVFFDVGETLVDETGMGERAADLVGVPRFTLMGVLGGLAARGEPHDRVWEVLGLPPPRVSWRLPDELYADALPCLHRLRAQGLLVGAAGNTGPDAETSLREHVHVVGSSSSWGVAKPDRAFFERIVEETGLAPDSVAYVGDRVDNDVLPAAAAGLVAVHVRRGPWGRLQATPSEAALAVDDLASLPQALASLA
ncbi:MAG: HAD family hydrolase [Gaiellaceae bacterium]